MFVPVRNSLAFLCRAIAAFVAALALTFAVVASLPFIAASAFFFCSPMPTFVRVKQACEDWVRTLLS